MLAKHGVSFFFTEMDIWCGAPRAVVRIGPDGGEPSYESRVAAASPVSVQVCARACVCVCARACVCVCVWLCAHARMCVCRTEEPGPGADVGGGVGPVTT